ncbi:hypothetical protein ACNO8X_04895 [Mycobacterium sp. PDNC021]|uniref:hypothetical protein n=1 Tax=Mycobacterium sp. PDNC021 TaxID=3391399 RepID=UPI003AAE702C
MLPSHTDPVLIAGLGACLWLAIWFGARDTELRKGIIAIGSLFAVTGGCGAVLVTSQSIAAPSLCGQGLAPCGDLARGLRSWIPMAASLAAVGLLAFLMNTAAAQERMGHILENKKDATAFQYGVALIMRIQPILVGFVGVATLFWSGDRTSGLAVLVIMVLLFALYAGSLFFVLRLVLGIEQLHKYVKAAGLIYAVAPVVLAITLLCNLNTFHLREALQVDGGDSRYFALLVSFVCISGYALFGVLLIKRLLKNLESVSMLTAGWVGAASLDQNILFSKLRGAQRSAHAVAVIAIGIAVGFLPPAFQLPDVLGMIIGVGCVALISFLDAELASRHLD